MKKKHKNKSDAESIKNDKIKDLKTERIRKTVLEETDPEYREEAGDFIRRYRDDTLTGL